MVRCVCVCVSLSLSLCSRRATRPIIYWSTKRQTGELELAGWPAGWLAGWQAGRQMALQLGGCRVVRS